MNLQDPPSVSKAATTLNELKKIIPLWVLGTEEPGRQLGLINMLDSRSSASKELADISGKVARLLWTQNPLDMQAAAACFNHEGRSGQGTGLLKTLLSSPQHEIPQEDLDNLLLSADSKLIIRHLFPFLRGPHSLSWLAGSWDTLLRMGSPELPLSILETIEWDEGLTQLRQRLYAEYRFLYGTPEEALKEVENLDGEVWSLWKDYMRAELLLRSDAKEEGIKALHGLWTENMWNINWGLKLHALKHPIDIRGALDTSDDVVILLYSWNNGALMEKTLKNVAASNIGGARVLALNNGSNDTTAEVVANAAERFQEGRYRGIQLPINVGAPPARNWLLSEPEARKAKWAVFLDDDVELPQNWLEHLLATAEHHGNPGAVGCRITSTSEPRSLQSADYHLFPPDRTVSQIEGLEERVMVFDSCRNAFDYGQFTYTRPAVHLSGCCHMLNMEAVHRCGGFDVRFNPTQFDDLERDLRAYAAGYTHVYAGQLGIGHIQHSSLAKASSAKSMAQVFGNKIKLESKYSEKVLNSVFTRDLESLWADAEKKWSELAG
ncbi:glycosyltransferase [Maridesulfovibrio sp.]|uniref:glycosyltransferase family 2 protein n=1 Tax=Maridesulfovibrio sp. TaxID=2795000 RepID=UPI002A1888F1|nr:glycosyltransferase [Maridesulfovibrio sp.]